jgi:hypothetical protein
MSRVTRRGARFSREMLSHALIHSIAAREVAFDALAINIDEDGNLYQDGKLVQNIKDHVCQRFNEIATTCGYDVRLI